MKNQILNVKSVMFLLVSVLLVCGIPAISYGQVCEVGDMISPGGRCKVVIGRETGWFSVQRDGSSVYQEVGGFHLDFDERVHCGDFAARKQADGTWLIEAVPGISVKPTLPGQIYWIQFFGVQKGIWRANLDGTNRQFLLGIEGQGRSIKVDGVGRKIYWTEQMFLGAVWVGGIRRANLDGSDVETLLQGRYKWRLALDIAGGKMYWTESINPGNIPGADGIRRANFDGSDIETIIDDGTNMESLVDGWNSDLVLDVVNRKLYWVNYSDVPKAHQIMRANFDGSDIETIIELPYSGPWWISNLTDMGVVDGKLYWIEMPNQQHDIPQNRFRIQRANLDGSNVETIRVESNFVSRTAFDVEGRKIYWIVGFSRPHEIWRMNLDGSNVEKVMTSSEIIEDFNFDSPPQSNLAVESLQPSNSALVPGESFTLSAIVRSSGDGESLPTTLGYYRSTNERFTPADTEVSRTTVSPIAGGDTSRAQVCLIAPTEPGTYYYGLGLGDQQTTETVKITVKPESDLAFKSFVTNIKTDDNILKPGASLRLAIIATNRGDGEASPTTLRYYRSTDEEFTADDTEVGKTDLSPLAVGAIKRHRILINAPTTPGVYYYGACIDTVGEERVTDNNCSIAIKVTVKSKSELAIESLQSSNSKVGTGESFKLSGVVRSTGEEKSSATTLRYYRSTDDALSAADDTEVGKTDVSSLAPDATSDVSITLTAPTEPGVYYYGACVGSNCSPAIKITVVREPKVLIAAAQRPPLYWIDTQAGTLHRLVGAKIEALVPNVQNATDLAVDIVNDRLYWAEKVDNRTGRIRAANLDGLNVKLVKDLTSVPVDIAVDTAGGKLYVINAWGKVQRMNLDGSKFEPNLIVDLEMPNHLTLDVARGKIYWTEQTGEDTGEIRRANLDGSDVELVKALTSVPLGLAADVTQRKLYVASSADKIQQLSFDGSNFRPNFITDVESPQKVAVDAMGGKMYWTEMGKFRRANLDGSNVQDIVRGLEGLPTGITLGIAAVLPTPTPPPTVEPEVVIAEVERPPLYWIDTQAGTLHRLVGAEVENLAPSVQNAVSLAVDVEGGKLYWTEKTSDKTGRIRRADLDGSNVQLVKDLTSVPHGIALDGVGGKIYITNAWGKVQRLNVDGSNFEPNLITGLDMPKNLALDVSDSKVYWTEMSGRIRRANLDGSNVEDIATGLGTPMNLVVFDGTAYWTEQTGENLGEIRRVNLDGTNSERLLTLTSIPQGIAVDAMENKLYWTNADGAIQRVNLDGSDIEELVTGLVSPGDLILQIAAPLPPPVVVEERVSTDVNEDGVVNIQDLVRVASSFGQTGENAADVNADGIVNIQDLVLVAGAFGSGAAAAPVLHIQTFEGFTASEVQHLLSRAREMSLTDPAYLRGIAVLEQLLALLVPKETSLLPNYPNPFNPETWIPYQLAKPTDVTFHIYAANGALVRTLALGHQSVGIYQNRSRAVYWDGRNESGEKVASGIYFYTLSADDFTATRKMLIMK